MRWLPAGYHTGAREVGMDGEQRLVNRELQTLPLGTRVRLTNGRTATLVALTFTSATVKIDPGQPPDRRANSRGEVEIAPAAEVELQQPAVPVPSTATLEDAASCADVEPLALEHGHRDALARVVPDERSLATPAG